MTGDLDVGFKEMIDENEEKDMPTVIANLGEVGEKKIMEYEYAKSIMNPTDPTMKKNEKSFTIINVKATTTATCLRDEAARSFGYEDGFSNLNLFFGDTKIT